MRASGAGPRARPCWWHCRKAVCIASSARLESWPEVAGKRAATTSLLTSVSGGATPPSSLAGAVALARARLAAADPRAAAQVLAGASVTATDQVPDLLRLEAWLLEAELGYGGGAPDRGRQALEQALKLAEKERVLLPFAIQRAWIEPVLRHDSSLAEAFRCLFQLPAPAGRPLSRPDAADQAASVIVEKLSGRELEVLRHVSRMLSTAEIAEVMYLSVNTVKSHLKSIFRKLGVSHRREAVRRARQLALL